jgi:hypothetical protein
MSRIHDVLLAYQTHDSSGKQLLDEVNRFFEEICKFR